MIIIYHSQYNAHNNKMKNKYDIDVILIDLIMLYSYNKILDYIELNKKKIYITRVDYRYKQTVDKGTYLQIILLVL